MEEEHEVYGGDIPEEVEGDMEGDMEAHPQDVDMTKADEDAAKELEEMKKRLKEMEEEAAALRDMQAKVEKEMGAVQDLSLFWETIVKINLGHGLNQGIQGLCNQMVHPPSGVVVP
eukprot:Gb_34131 [translate_table: standard]